ncbi:MAG: Tripeptidyl-peptidase sed1 [Alectoria sarmentosa]|nr:MAG: Tripeptidyl-peptidase sed1 [Alectoria sarmentosa]
MRLQALMYIGAIALTATAAPTFTSHVVHEKRQSEPLNWAKYSRVDPSTILPIRIGLRQSNLDNGPGLLDEVSNPASSRYGQHYTAEEIHDIFAPQEKTVKSVSAWLQDSGIAPHRISQSFNKQWLQFDATASEIESLIKTEYYNYAHYGTGKTNIGCDEYSLPHHVREHVDYITPGLKLLTPSRSRKDPELQKRIFGVTTKNHDITKPKLKALPQSLTSLLAEPLSAICDVAAIPLCIKTLYNITTPTKNAAGNQLGIFEDLDDMYSQTDLNDFFLTLAPNIPQGTHPTLDSIDGATAPTTVTDAGPESDLDFQISYPIIYPQNSILFQTDDDVYEANYTYEGFLNNFLDAIDGSYCTYTAFNETGNSVLDPPYPDPQAGGYKGSLECGVYKPTNVISISYGGQEFDLPASYQERQCNEFMKLGMQGISLVVASGDSGVAGPAGDDNTDGCLGPAGTIFSPDFPATCPYLTTAGATFLPPGGDVTKDQEVAVTRFASGGGFSNIYAIPSYQASAVSTYFSTAGTQYPYYSSTNNNSFGANGGIYNINGRGYPDVSAIGDNVVIFNEGAPTLIGGTSAAAPTFASILNRINEERIAVGKTTIGFVNPTLYSNPQVLHDITNGSNPGCGTNGFAVAKGWDPVTGLGTPNYPAMLSLFMSMP